MTDHGDAQASTEGGYGPERVVEALIVGGGVSGIGASIRLRRDAGLRDVLILERAEALGGTWLHNTYPGCACDIPSLLYSYEFAPNPDWRRVFAGQAEIRDYLQRVAREHDVPARTVFGADVLEASWDEPAQLWRLRTTKGRFAAPILLFGPGPLHEPRIPDVPGLDTFTGTSFHSARWDHDHDLTGKRVAVVGTGPSAIQFVPEIAPKVARMTVLQRTPGWLIPKLDWPTTALERWIYRRLPGAHAVARRAQWVFSDLLLKLYADHRLARLLNLLGRAHLRAVVRDPELRRALTPDYAFGCKRILLSNSFYPALQRDNVELVPYGIREVRENAVVAADGSVHEVDTIIWGTGFFVSDLPFTERIRGRDGRTLAQTWAGNPSAYLGTSVAGFPNAFMLFGPNIGTVSAFPMLEGQLNHVTAAVRAMRERGLTSVEMKPDVLRDYKAGVDERLAGSTWNAGGCTSYYMDATGTNYSVYPGTMRELVREGARFDVGVYDTRSAQVPDPSDHHGETGREVAAAG
ncbi:MAG TPA: NAD(P)/FAD-dependent oxidoreductase [Pseudonocardia sp.]|nr:NAD(P)/FAD-dependent oxidoreductase [Pseudonocardia sp.]